MNLSQQMSNQKQDHMGNAVMLWIWMMHWRSELDFSKHFLSTFEKKMEMEPKTFGLLQIYHNICPNYLNFLLSFFFFFLFFKTKEVKQKTEGKYGQVKFHYKLVGFLVLLLQTLIITIASFHQYNMTHYEIIHPCAFTYTAIPTLIILINYTSSMIQ